ncbi:oxidoreductase [Pedobacter sp. SL55]|uniref:oxidoreductase n=1 Tax=Pedobacter sp. SL55 TaxID=2995161 RepID=UPI00226E2734|nr:oxidoreductase [Pedobacter sp. SL55]WAC40631.1 oxidoreductase [Pedobacter sp. SL55]
MKKAIIFGASGFIGSYLLSNLLQSDTYSEVTIVVRKPLNIQHPKLKMVIADYHSLAQNAAYLAADDVFISLGTTKKKTPDQKEYYQIDHDYPVLAAQLTKANGASAVMLLSAVGANAKSNIFYTKTKGEAERDVIAVGFEHTHIFRPSIIMGNRAESRPLEKIFIKIFSVANLLLVGKLNKYKGITAENIAKAMIKAAQIPTEKVKFYHWKEMIELS